MRYALALAVLLSGASAQAMTGSLLYDYCTDTSAIHDMREGECMSYIEGVWDDIEQGILAPDEGTRLACPHGMTLGTARRVFIAWAQRYPQFLDRNAAMGVMAAFHEAYPCK